MMGKAMNVKEVAEFLDVSISTIYNWVKQGFIPCYKFQKKIVFFEEEILEWLKNFKIDKSHYRKINVNIT